MHTFKFLLFYFVLFTFSKSISAQSYYYGGIGYNMAILKSEGLDFVVDRYNETRNYLDQPMDQCRFYDGATIHFGGVASGFLFDLGWTMRSCKVSASGTDLSGTEQQRDLKSKWNTIDIGLGVGLGGSDHFALMLGVNTGLNSEKQLTRADTPEDIGVANFEKVNSNYKIGFEPFVQFIVAAENGPGLLIKPYYSWTPITSDYYELNTYMNPYTYGNDPLTIEGRLTGFGISFMIIGYGYED